MFRARFIDFVGVEDFEESEIGPIPTGWQVRVFSDAVDINPAVKLTKGTVAPFVEMGPLRRGRCVQTGLRSDPIVVARAFNQVTP